MFNAVHLFVARAYVAFIVIRAMKSEAAFRTSIIEGDIANVRVVWVLVDYVASTYYSTVTKLQSFEPNILKFT
jgi:hypothetical protein